MLLNYKSEKPIYLQLAEAIEDDILRGIFEEETQVPSTTDISVGLKINPATAGKGINLLVDEGILTKKRGIGMFVSCGARQTIAEKRKEAFLENFIAVLLDEAKKLHISKQEIIDMIGREHEYERD